MFDDLSMSMSDGHVFTPRSPQRTTYPVPEPDLDPLEEAISLTSSPTLTPPAPQPLDALDHLDAPRGVEDVKMSADLDALMGGLSDSEEKDSWGTPGSIGGRRVSLEDDMENEQMEEDNEPLGDLDEDGDEHAIDGDDGEEEEEEILNILSLSQLMHDSKLDPAKSKRAERLHEYLSESLGITFAHEMLEHSPSAITQPPGDEFKSTKLRMRLMKMAKFVTAQIVESRWTGEHRQDWLELESNTVTSYTFAKPQRIEEMKSSSSTVSVARSPRGPTVMFEAKDGGDPSDHTNVKGQRMTCIDKEIVVGQTLSYTFTVDTLPEIDRKKGQKVCSLGIPYVV